MKKTIHVSLVLPWYNGPDLDCTGWFLTFQHYLGRLQERLNWLLWAREKGINVDISEFSKLDESDPTGLAEVPEWLRGTELKFSLASVVGVSLPGLARERGIDLALAAGADYVLFYDDDMMFNASAFLGLLAHKKPVVAALAFTAREPIAPVIYKFTEHQDRGSSISLRSDPILDYLPNQLQQVDAVGFGMVLIQASVFRQMPKPWFNAPGVGEDIQFCVMCKRYNIPVFVDTSIKTIHKPRYHAEWHSEEMYLRERAKKLEKAQ